MLMMVEGVSRWQSMWWGVRQLLNYTERKGNKERPSSLLAFTVRRSWKEVGRERIWTVARCDGDVAEIGGGTKAMKKGTSATINLSHLEEEENTQNFLAM